MGFHLGSSAFCPAAATCKLFLDHSPIRHHRSGNFVCLLIDCRICNRPDARQDRDDFRCFLRSHVRSGRHRFGILRMARGQDKHLVHFQCQRLSATSRRRGRISARHEEKAIKTKDEDLPDDSALKKSLRLKPN